MALSRRLYLWNCVEYLIRVNSARLANRCIRLQGLYAQFQKCIVARQRVRLLASHGSGADPRSGRRDIWNIPSTYTPTYSTESETFLPRHCITMSIFSWFQKVPEPISIQSGWLAYAASICRAGPNCIPLRDLDHGNLIGKRTSMLRP